MDLNFMLVFETKYPLKNPRISENTVEIKDCSKENTRIFFRLRSKENTGGYWIKTKTTGVIKNIV